MDEFVVSDGFCQEIKTICNNKTHQIDPKIVRTSKTFKFLSFFHAFFVQSSGDSWAPNSKIFKIERPSYAVPVLTRTLQRFASKTLQNDSK